jgi:hypothetical protein
MLILGGTRMQLLAIGPDSLGSFRGLCTLRCATLFSSILHTGSCLAPCAVRPSSPRSGPAPSQRSTSPDICTRELQHHAAHSAACCLALWAGARGSLRFRGFALVLVSHPSARMYAYPQPSSVSPSQLYVSLFPLSFCSRPRLVCIPHPSRQLHLRRTPLPIPAHSGKE